MKVRKEYEKRLENLRKQPELEKMFREGGIDPNSGKNLVTKPFDEKGNLKPDVVYLSGEHNYLYETDELGRITKFEAKELKLKEALIEERALAKKEGRKVKSVRDSHETNTPGKLPNDAAGHLAADRFGGSGGIDNLVSQAENLNNGDYKKLENLWDQALSEVPPKKVHVQVEALYKGSEKRPYAFKVRHKIGNNRIVDKVFENVNN